MYLVINLSPVIINSMFYANGSVISITYLSRHAIEVEQISKHVFKNTQSMYELLEALKFSTYFLLQQLRRKQTNFSEEKMTPVMYNCDLKLILAKRKLLRRCFTVI